MNVHIDDTNLVNLSGGAKEKLCEQTKEYADELLKEANLIEEGNRAVGAQSEITSNIIMQAANVKKSRYFAENKPPIWLKIAKIVSTLSCLVTGFLFDTNGYQDNLGGWLAS